MTKRKKLPPPQPDLILERIIRSDLGDHHPLGWHFRWQYKTNNRKHAAILVGLFTVLDVLVTTFLIINVLTGTRSHMIIVPGPVRPPATAAVVFAPGQNYQICDANSSYLTSPYTYDALATGTATYTVAQYEALTGYGTTLPPLPSYIAAEASTQEAAEIFAPGSTVALESYQVPLQPIIYFFEGGNYGLLGLQPPSGSELIGGSAPGFASPMFNNGGQSAGINPQQDSFDGYQIATTNGAVVAGSNTVTLTSSQTPIVPYEKLSIGGQIQTVQSISGTQSAYTLTLVGGVYANVPSGAAVLYESYAASETVEYLNIADDLNNTATISTGQNWTIEHNDIHDGTSSTDQNSGTGVYDAIAGGQGATMEYNCFENEGHAGIHELGSNAMFAYNEVENSPTYGGSGGDAGDKWWATANDTIEYNSFVKDGPGEAPPVWFDNGNTGMLVQGNYFYACSDRCVNVETGFNADITGNEFLDSGWDTDAVANNGVVNFNDSGGWPIPGSRYNNESLVTNNEFINNWNYITIWGEGDRSCLLPQEAAGTAPYNNSAYCTGGFPNGDGQFSIYNYPSNESTFATVLVAANSGSNTIVVQSDNGLTPAISDYIGTTGVTSSGYPSTTTTSTSAVTSFTGTQTLAIASTTGFLTSGQIMVGTSFLNNQGRGTGAILSYNGVGTGVLDNVSYVSGSGNLVNGGWVQAVEPYHITAVTPLGNAWQLTITPPLTSALTVGTSLYDDGTCYTSMTGASLANTGNAPDGLSYFDGCIWENRNISITGNTFTFSPSAITSGPNFWGNTNYQTCQAGIDTNGCGTNFMEWDIGGTPPYNSALFANAIMSNSSFTGPLNNANALNPPWGSTLQFGTTPLNNGETSWNNLWSGNSYTGPMYFYAYNFGQCEAPTGYSCFVNLAQWQSQWLQD